MNDYKLQSHVLSLNKRGEELCGDFVVKRTYDSDLVFVLSDGLGSGVKANILATLSSTMIATMIGRGITLEEVMDTVINTLPVCKERGLAYSTFTIFHIRNERHATIINYDNPLPIILRDGRPMDLTYRHVEISGRTLHSASFTLEKDDVLLSMSDGCIHAGQEKTLNKGWQRDHIVEYMKAMYVADYSARTLSELLIDECESLYNGHALDDTTVLTVKVKKRKHLNLFVGPPAHMDTDEKAMRLFLGKKGKHVVCGGSTGHMFERYLNQTLVCNRDAENGALPPTAKMEGIDLVSEGVLTLSHVLSNAKRYLNEDERFLFHKDADTITKLCHMLFEEATDIHFFVGTAINPAHEDSNLPFNHTTKMQSIKALTHLLKNMDKTVRVTRY